MTPKSLKVPPGGSARRPSSQFRLRAPRSPARAFTRGELLAVLVALTLLAAVAWPAPAHGKPRAQRSSCVNNLRQIGQSFRLWENDHSDKFPWQFPPLSSGYVTGGTQGKPQAWEHFNAISNEMTDARLLVCPSDTGRNATNFPSNVRRNNNISYFIGTHVAETVPESFVSGDRDIQGNGSADVCGVAGNITVTSFPPFSFSGIRWSLTNHVDSGNFTFSDGSVALLATPGLKRVLTNSKVRESSGNSHILKPLLNGEQP